MLKAAFTAALVILAGAGLGIFAPAAANAQYPPENVTLLVAAGDLNPTVGGTVAITASANDAAGQPIEGEDCIFTITSQPGTDASVDPETATTDAQGLATTTLHTGSTAGDISVETGCAGVTEVLTVVVGTSPPASEPEDLPSSGTGPGDQSRGTNNVYLAALIIALFTVSLGGLYAARFIRR